MKIAQIRPQLLRLAGVAVLAVASSAAMAQSQEYRRGYDQGYRDGQAAAMQGARGPIREERYDERRSRIDIEQADYGVRNAACDARPAVRQAIGRGSNFSITASNNLCGDPAPGSRKRLTVIYRCGNSPTMRAEADEGKAMTLNCQ